MYKCIFSVLLILLSNSYLFSTENLASNTELVFQVQNNPSSQIVKVNYSSVPGTAIVYSSTCSYTSFDDFSFTQNIAGNKTTDEYYATIKTDVETISNYEMVHALIKIEFIIGSIVKKVLYYDQRDCQYYTPCDMHTGDVTVRYDYTADKLWLKKGVITEDIASLANGWEEITSGATKNFWNVYEIEHCSITQPQKPAGLSITTTGGHPRLDWIANTESDLVGYKVYKKDGTSYFSQIGTTTNNYYIDFNETIGLLYPQIFVQYYVKAFNSDFENSFPSDVEQIKVYDNNAQKRQGENSTSLEEMIFGMQQNYPNPFNPSTIIKYSVKNEGYVFLAVYNQLGEHIQTLVDEFKNIGSYEVNFEGAYLTNGVYYYKIITNDFVESKKMILLK